MEIRKVALIGMGAIGGFMASKLSHAMPKENLLLIAEGERKARLEKGVCINEEKHFFKVVTPSEKEEVDLVLIATKYNELEKAAQDIAPFVGEHTVIMSLLNGVSSEAYLQGIYGNRVIYSLMRVSSVRTEAGITFAKDRGYLEFGEAENGILSERVEAISQLFKQAQIDGRIPGDMKKALWLKYACNIAENQSSALLGIPFGAWHVSHHANALREAAMREVFAVAGKMGVSLGEEEIKKQYDMLQTVPYPNKTSMLQDLENGRPTEVEMFAGEMIEMGKKVGVATPINEVFYHSIHVLEEKNKGFI